jgi:hypothetical protein
MRDVTPRRAEAKPAYRWSELARRARPALAAARFGEREIRLKALAQEFGVNPQTLRRALAALKFVESLEANRFLKKLALRQAPMAAIEHVARWHAYDPAAALRAARLLAEGGHTVASLNAAERQARAAARPGQTGQALLHNCRRRVGPVLRAQFKDFEMTERGARRAEDPAIDFRFRPPGAARWTVAAIIMGPYRDQSRYRIRLGEWVVKALGLAALYERVILVVPTAALKRRSHAWLDANGLGGDRFEIQVVTPEP